MKGAIQRAIHARYSQGSPAKRSPLGVLLAKRPRRHAVHEDVGHAVPDEGLRGLAEAERGDALGGILQVAAVVEQDRIHLLGGPRRW